MKMNKLFLSALLLTVPMTGAHMYAAASNQVKNLPVGPKIRVLLEKDVPSAMLEARGNYTVIRKDTGATISSGILDKRFTVHALQTGMRWGEEYPDVYQISVVPNGPNSTILVNGIQYKGAVSVYRVQDSRITIVNEIPVEDYTKSFMATRVEENMSKEALVALAIATRTEIYAKVLQGAKSLKPWDISARDHDYFGFGITRGDNGVEMAVDLTRYMVLESHKADFETMHADKADELAKQGLDAQKILKTLYPHAKIATTIDPDEVAVRY